MPGNNLNININATFNNKGFLEAQKAIDQLMGFGKGTSTTGPLAGKQSSLSKQLDNQFKKTVSGVQASNNRFKNEVRKGTRDINKEYEQRVKQLEKTQKRIRDISNQGFKNLNKQRGESFYQRYKNRGYSQGARFGTVSESRGYLRENDKFRIKRDSPYYTRNAMSNSKTRGLRDAEFTSRGYSSGATYGTVGQPVTSRSNAQKYKAQRSTPINLTKGGSDAVLSKYSEPQKSMFNTPINQASAKPLSMKSATAGFSMPQSGGQSVLGRMYDFGIADLTFRLMNKMMTGVETSFKAKSEFQSMLPILPTLDGSKLSNNDVGYLSNFVQTKVPQIAPKMNKYEVGSQLTEMASMYNLNKTQIDLFGKVFPGIANRFAKEGRSTNDAMLAVRDFIEGEYIRGREIGVDKTILKKYGMKGEVGSAEGVTTTLEALGKISSTRNWDVLATKLSSFDDMLEFSVARVSETLSDGLGIIEPKLAYGFNTAIGMVDQFGKTVNAINNTEIPVLGKVGNATKVGEDIFKSVGGNAMLGLGGMYLGGRFFSGVPGLAENMAENLFRGESYRQAKNSLPYYTPGYGYSQESIGSESKRITAKNLNSKDLKGSKFKNIYQGKDNTLYRVLDSDFKEVSSKEMKQKQSGGVSVYGIPQEVAPDGTINNKKATKRQKLGKVGRQAYNALGGPLGIAMIGAGVAEMVQSHFKNNTQLLDTPGERLGKTWNLREERLSSLKQAQSNLTSTIDNLKNSLNGLDSSSKRYKNTLDDIKHYENLNNTLGTVIDQYEDQKAKEETGLSLFVAGNSTIKTRDPKTGKIAYNEAFNSLVNSKDKGLNDPNYWDNLDTYTVNTIKGDFPRAGEIATNYRNYLEKRYGAVDVNSDKAKLGNLMGDFATAFESGDSETIQKAFDQTVPKLNKQFKLNSNHVNPLETYAFGLGAQEYVTTGGDLVRYSDLVNKIEKLKTTNPDDPEIQKLSSSVYSGHISKDDASRIDEMSGGYGTYDKKGFKPAKKDQFKEQEDFFVGMLTNPFGTLFGGANKPGVLGDFTKLLSHTPQGGILDSPLLDFLFPKAVSAGNPYAPSAGASSVAYDQYGNTVSTSSLSESEKKMTPQTNVSPSTPLPVQLMKTASSVFGGDPFKGIGSGIVGFIKNLSPGKGIGSGEPRGTGVNIGVNGSATSQGNRFTGTVQGTANSVGNRFTGTVQGYAKSVGNRFTGTVSGTAIASGATFTGSIGGSVTIGNKTVNFGGSNDSTRDWVDPTINNLPEYVQNEPVSTLSNNNNSGGVTIEKIEVVIPENQVEEANSAEEIGEIASETIVDVLKKEVTRIGE